MPRRILLLITDLEIGGTPTVVRELATRLHHPPDVEVEVACLKKWGPVADQLKAAGIRVTAFDASSGFQIPRTIRKLRELVHERAIDTVFSFLLHANTVAAIASKKLADVRFIQSIQTVQPRPRWHWWMQSWIQRYADAIVAPSNAVRLFGRDRCHIPDEKIIVIPNAIDPEAFNPSVISSQNPHPYPIGFIARLDPIKRVPHLLTAFHELRLRGLDVHLHLFGEGSQRSRIVSQIDRLNLQTSVTLHGVIPRPQDALTQIGLLVLPSEAEGFGLVLIEAMAADVPIVASDAPGIRDVVRHDHTGLLVPLADPSQLADAMRRIVEDQRLRERLIAAASQDVRERFTWNAILPMYRRLLKLDQS